MKNEKTDADVEHCAGDAFPSTMQGIERYAPGAVARPEPTVMQLMDRAMDLGAAGAEVIERLTRLRLELEDRQAKREFFTAFRLLRREIPPIQANGKTDKGVPYMYYEDIMEVLQPLLDKHGFSKSFKESAITDKGDVTFELHLTHDGGYKEVYPRTFPTDKAALNASGKAIRSAIQDSGSTTSYAKRYLTVSTFDIIEKGMDTNGDPMKKITLDQATVLRDLIAETGTKMEAFLEMIADRNSVEEILDRDYGRCKKALEAKKRAKQS